MPLLFDDEASVGTASNRGQDVCLTPFSRFDQHVRDVASGDVRTGPLAAADGEARHVGLVVGKDGTNSAANEETRDIESGVEGLSDLSALRETGNGRSFFRRNKREAGILEINSHVHSPTPAPSRPTSTDAQPPTEGTTVTSSLQQTHAFETNNHPSVRTASTSFASSTITLMDSHGVVSEPGLPDQRYVQIIHSIRWKILNVYSRLQLLVLIPNVIAMTIVGVLNGPGLQKIPITHLATAATANILAAIVIRQELVINALFIIFGHCPQWFPLRFRRLSAKIYHLGGVHSGAGFAGAIWFILASAATFQIDSDVTSNGMRKGIWAVTAVLDGLLVTIVCLSLPQFRQRYHDVWEWTHRFCGWAAIAAFWALLILLTIVYKGKETAEPPMWQAMINSPIFWMLVIITCCIIAPWLNLRKVPVTAEQLSSHVVRLHFTYTTPPLCSAPRLSDKPLREWHAFASIPEDSGPGFSILVSAAGDWTKKIIKDPPKYLWKRGWLARGVMNVAPIFKSMVIVVTGSGIGPVLSLLKGAPNIRNVHVLWSTRDPMIHYGQAVVDDVLAADPEAVIINTTASSQRPDLLEKAYTMYVETGAEAVFVVSNPKGTREVVYGLESRGVPAFSPIFDS